jgi:uncharacterized membrane protein required for colicin V production
MKFAISWFDLFAVAMIGVGVFVGRKRGMSSELLDVLAWVAIVLGGAYLYPRLSQTLVSVTGLSQTTSHITSYLIIATLVFSLFLVIKRNFGEKLVSADFFGGFEYYLGMVAGAFRFLCIVVFILAVLHGPRVTDEQLNRQLAAQNESLGSIYFPPFGSIQRHIFRSSITGQTVEQHLQFALVTTDASFSSPQREGIGRRREREVNDVIGR